MGVRQPMFAYAHAARTLGASALTLTTGTNASFSTERSRLIDQRANRLLQVTAAASVVEIDLDTGAGGPPTINRLLIPAGHNLATATVTVQEDDNAGFSSPTQLGQVVSPGAGLIDLALTAATERYIRLDITSAPSTVEIGELIYTDRITIAAPDDVDPRDWRDEEVSNVRVDELPSGVEIRTDLSGGVLRNRIELGFPRMTDTGFAQVDGLRSGVGGIRDPFWAWSPDDTKAAVWVRFERDAETRQGSPNPKATGPQYDFTMRMLEVVG